MNTSASPLPPEVLRIFSRKGEKGALGEVRVKGDANGVKVRRVLQVVADVLRKPISECRVLDLACGEGVYSIELGLHGATAEASDGPPTGWRKEGCIDQLGLDNVKMLVEDLRAVRPETHGTFDVVLFLGILYHLDASDIIPVLKTLHSLCTRALIIDTHVSLFPTDSVEHGKDSYFGTILREHPSGSDDAAKQEHLLQSIDNEFAFFLTRASLVKLPSNIGFTSVFEVYAPLEGGKPTNRRTFVASRGEQHTTLAYPWVNDKNEAEVAAQLREFGARVNVEETVPRAGVFAMKVMNRFLRRYGLSVQGIQ